jgi:hypothetical protein
MKNISFLSTLLFIFLLTACSTSVTATVQSPAISSVKTKEGQSMQSQSPSQSAQEVSFSKDILPIFQQYSDAHHGSNSMLSLETYEGVIQDVIPGQPEQSKLYLRLIGQGGPVMPPGNALPENLITLIFNWIKQGARNN